MYFFNLLLSFWILTCGIIATIISLATRQATENDSESPKAAHMKQKLMTECDSNPCKNGGVCTASANGYLCNCPDGYEGKQCKKKIINQCDSGPCKNNGSCIDHGGGYRCRCLSGFAGHQCEEEIDDCASMPCKNGATCTDLVNGYNCQCLSGYSGSQCQTDIDDCAPNPCQNNATCIDEVAGYRCHCPTGYSGKQCQENIDDCASNPCQNNATCIDEVAGYSCHCPAGYSGKQCKENIDDCISNPCQNNATCIDQVASFRCHCRTGYSGKQCQNAPYKAEVRVKAEYEKGMGEIGSFIYNKTLELFKPLIQLICEKFPVCELNGFRNGSVVIAFAIQTSKNPNQITNNMQSAIQEAGVNNAEVKTIQKQEVNGNWGSWDAWDACSVTCGNGTRTRERRCNNPTPSIGETTCTGSAVEQDNCYLLDCPPAVNGNWGSWAKWDDCSATCGFGTRTRRRQCNNPIPSNGGASCDGSAEDQDNCFLIECPVNGNWGSWAEWDDCSATCGFGTRTRRRQCNNPTPSNGGASCDGNAEDHESCYLIECPVNRHWSNWGAWDDCSITCWFGTRTRRRQCDSPAPSYGGAKCYGNAGQNSICRLGHMLHKFVDV